MAKILIAGLPNAGKSTYIAALAYTLKEAKDDMIYKMVEVPEDMSVISNLYDSWLEQRSVDRTARGSAVNIPLTIQKSSLTIELSLPDVAGEEFERLFQNQSDIIMSWSETPDALLFLIKDLPTDVLVDSFDDSTTTSGLFPAFNPTHMSAQIKNLLLVKELTKQFPFKKIAIGISAWDVKNCTGSPKVYLQKHFPVFYNYIMHYYPDSYIFGLSAQGADYNETNYDYLEESTQNGTRAYIINSADKVYDLTTPIDFLIS